MSQGLIFNSNGQVIDKSFIYAVTFRLANALKKIIFSIYFGIGMSLALLCLGKVDYNTFYKHNQVRANEMINTCYRTRKIFFFIN